MPVLLRKTGKTARKAAFPSGFSLPAKKQPLALPVFIKFLMPAAARHENKRNPAMRGLVVWCAPTTVRPLARDPRVLIGWLLPLSWGLGGCLLLARRGRVYV